MKIWGIKNEDSMETFERHTEASTCMKQSFSTSDSINLAICETFSQ